jgi:hypothetical protein
MEAIARVISTAQTKSPIEFEMYGIPMCFNDYDLMYVQKKSELYGLTATAITFLTNEFTQYTAFALPVPASDLEKAYPFKSAALDWFLSGPHDDMNLDAAKKRLEPIQKQYVDYLFNTLERTAKDGDKRLLKLCADRICDMVVDHIDNARAHLNDQRRKLLIELLTEHDMITDGMVRTIIQAGAGPSSWDALAREGKVGKQKLLPPKPPSSS